MTKQEILQKAVEKAIENKWDMFGYFRKGTIRNKQFARYYFTDQNYTHGAGGSRQDQLSIESRSSTSIFYLHISIPEVIFNHKFAKAFFGEGSRCNACPLKDEDHKFGETGHPYISLWRYHLQQMVLEEDPILYLEKYL